MDDWKSNPALFDAFDKDTIERYALSFAHTNAVDDAKLFMQTLGCDTQRSKNPQNLNAFVHALLYNDHADLAWSCLNNNARVTWGARNTHHLVHNCPQVFNKWMQPHALGLVVQALGILEPSQKEAVLRGAGATEAQRYVFDALKQNPGHWSLFSPGWLGEEHSPLRRLATGLGWTPSMIPRMLRNGQYRGMSDWNHVLDHPYSCYVLGIFERFSNGNASSMDSKLYLGVMASTFSDDPKTHSQDAALMKILLTECGALHPEFKYDKYVHHNKDVPHITDTRWKELRDTVRAYLALGNSSGLLEEIIHNRLTKTTQFQSLDLPDLASSGPA